MQRKIIGVLIAGVLAMSFGASVQAQMYISVNVGGSFLTDADTTDTSPVGSASGEVTTDAGFALTGAVGYAMLNGLRIEGEISYRENDLDTFDVDTITSGGATFSGAPVPLPLKGEATALGFMANAFYDFDTGSNWVPHIGGGLGVAILTLNIESIGGFSSSFDETDTVFAYQIGAGLGYRVNSYSRFDVSYRLMGTSDPKFSDGFDTVETEYLNHSIMAGYTYSF